MPPLNPTTPFPGTPICRPGRCFAGLPEPGSPVFAIPAPPSSARSRRPRRPLSSTRLVRRHLHSRRSRHAQSGPPCAMPAPPATRPADAAVRDAPVRPIAIPVPPPATRTLCPQRPQRRSHCPPSRVVPRHDRGTPLPAGPRPGLSSEPIQPEGLFTRSAHAGAVHWDHRPGRPTALKPPGAQRTTPSRRLRGTWARPQVTVAPRCHTSRD